MKDLTLTLFPKTPVSSLLAIRPLSMTILERTGVNPFHASALTLEDLCRDIGMTWDALVGEILALKIPERDSDWDGLPLYHLLDFLTREHREFIYDFVPAIKTAFTADEGEADFLNRLLPLVKAWPDFSSALVEHIGTEESFLFPKILRYEYCLEHGPAEPDFSDGSIKVFASLHMMRNERKQVEAIRDFLDASSYSDDPEKMAAPASGLFRLLETFQERLLEHSRMEREILFPRAESLEKRLYDCFINGRTQVPSGPSALAGA